MRLFLFGALIILLSGLTYLRNGIWLDNPHLWRDVMEKSTKKIRAYNNFGNALDASAVELSIDIYRKALQIAPKDPVLHYNLGHALVAKGSFDQAVAHFRDASRYFSDALIYLTPKSHKEKTVKYLELSLVDLGAAQIVQGDITAAIVSFIKALEFNPDNPLAHYNLGVAYAKTNMAEQSLFHLNRANEIDPHGFPQRFTSMPLLDIHDPILR